MLITVLREHKHRTFRHSAELIFSANGALLCTITSGTAGSDLEMDDIVLVDRGWVVDDDLLRTRFCDLSAALANSRRARMARLTQSVVA